MDCNSCVQTFYDNAKLVERKSGSLHVMITATNDPQNLVISDQKKKVFGRDCPYPQD